MSTGDDGCEEKTTLHVTATVEVPKGVVAKEGPAEQERKAKHDKLMLGTQAAIAFVGVVGLLMTIMTLRLTRETFRTGRRAWVLRAERINLPRGSPQPDQPWSAEVLVQNAGESPALNVFTEHKVLKITGTIKHVPDDPRAWDKYASETTLASPTEDGPSRSLLGPGQTKQSVVPLPVLSADEIGMVEREELAVYIVTWIVYRDIFRLERHTVECSRIMLKPRRMADCGGDTSRAD